MFYRNGLAGGGWQGWPHRWQASSQASHQPLEIEQDSCSHLDHAGLKPCANICRSGLVSRWGAKRPQVFSFAAKIAGAAARPNATQGRSYKGQCWLVEIHKTVAPIGGVQAFANLAWVAAPAEMLPASKPGTDLLGSRLFATQDRLQEDCANTGGQHRPCGSGFTREHQHSRCHASRWILRG